MYMFLYSLYIYFFYILFVYIYTSMTRVVLVVSMKVLLISCLISASLQKKKYKLIFNEKRSKANVPARIGNSIFIP